MPYDADTNLGAGQLSVWPVLGRVAVDERVVELAPKEFDLLVALTSRPGQVVSFETLLKEVWDTDLAWLKPTVVEHMSRLRAKLKLDASRKPWFQSVRGKGYRYERRDWTHRPEQLPAPVED